MLLTLLTLLPTLFFFLMIRRPPRSTLDRSSAASDVYKRQAPNKGELLLVEIPDLPTTNIYKKGMMLTPLSTPGLWWIGSNYAWEFDNPDATPAFKEKTEALLKEWLKVPFKIVDHLAGIRPATLERRPFVGLHPLYPNIGILNGMGTKAVSYTHLTLPTSDLV